MRLVIEGPPVTKKNSMQMARNKRTGAVFPVQSKPQKAWAEKAVWQIRAQSGGSVYACPVNMAAIVYRAKAVGDLLNYLAAVSDALEAAGVVTNDRLIVSLDGSRMLKDADRPRVEVELTVVA